jgi:hypothetical protein
MPDPVFRVTLRALPDDVPAGWRLAGLLRVALRRFRFRCEEASEDGEDEATEVERLQGIVNGLAARCAAQAELLRAGREEGERWARRSR